MDDESGESMEPTEEVPLKGLQVNQTWGDQCGVDGEQPGVDTRDEGKHAGRNDLLFVEKMMLTDKRV